MITRREAYISCKQYVYCMGYSLQMDKTTETKDNKTAVKFRICRKNTLETLIDNLTLDEVSEYIRLRIPEAFLTGFPDGSDTWELYHDVTEREKTLNRAIDSISGFLHKKGGFIK